MTEGVKVGIIRARFFDSCHDLREQSAVADQGGWQGPKMGPWGQTPCSMDARIRQIKHVG